MEQLPMLQTTTTDQIFDTSWAQWIPGNVNVVDEVISKLTSGYYPDSIFEVLEDLHQDIGTYLFVVRELAIGMDINDKINSQGDPTSLEAQPQQFSNLISILKSAKKKLCADHNVSRLKQAEDFQIEVLRESYFSYATVSSLSNSLCPNDEKLATTVSLLRSIGRILLAWNYPKEFSNAIEISRASVTTVPFDLLLTNIFPCSPATLGAKVALEIGFNKDVIAIINPKGTNPRPSTTPALTKIILKICDIAECFSFANSGLPHHTPEENLARSLSFIEDTIGANGITNLYQRVEKLSESYEKLFPELFTSKQEDLSELVLSDQITLKKLAKNAGIIDLEHPKLLLKKNAPKSALFKSVRELFYSTLPGRGVHISSVFVLSPIELTLLPMFNKGKPSFISIAETPLYADSSKVNPIRSVFTQRQIETIEGLNSDKQDVLACLIPLGGKEPLGVIYLESLHNEVGAEELKEVAKLMNFLLSRLYK